MTEYRVDVDGGKYTVVIPESGRAHVLRHGEPWLHELPAGANCWIAMACELHELRQRVVAEPNVDTRLPSAEEAAVLRHLSDNAHCVVMPKFPHPTIATRRAVYLARELGWIAWGPKITDTGRAALAAYDAKVKGEGE